jgi:hypothetical protein
MLVAGALAIAPEHGTCVEEYLIAVRMKIGVGLSCQQSGLSFIGGVLQL